MNTAAIPPTARSEPRTGPARRTGWHALEVTEVRRLTADAVAVALEVPAGLRAVFAHRPGQHVVVRHRRPGGELRRSYSVCPPPHDPTALRLVIERGSPDGFGAHATTRLAPGNHLELSPPTGTFALPDLPGGHHVLLAGGSGITPLAAMAADVLRRDPACRVSLVHSVRTSCDALLADELAELKDAFVDRFTVLYVVTGEDTAHGGGPLGGRLDGAGLDRLLTALDARPAPDTAHALCGPPGLVATARRVLADAGADPALVRRELFTTAAAPGESTDASPSADPSPPADPSPSADPSPPADPSPSSGASPTAAPSPLTETSPPARTTRITVLLGGRRRYATVLPQDTAVLDALLRADPDVPYACREGVCGSCRAKVLSGQVAARGQHALDERDRAAGYTLVCRARPRSAELTLDFDA